MCQSCNPKTRIPHLPPHVLPTLAPPAPPSLLFPSTHTQYSSTSLSSTYGRQACLPQYSSSSSWQLFLAAYMRLCTLTGSTTRAVHKQRQKRPAKPDAHDRMVTAQQRAPHDGSHSPVKTAERRSATAMCILTSPHLGTADALPCMCHIWRTCITSPDHGGQRPVRRLGRMASCPGNLHHGHIQAQREHCAMVIRREAAAGSA